MPIPTLDELIRFLLIGLFVTLLYAIFLDPHRKFKNKDGKNDDDK